MVPRCFSIYAHIVAGALVLAATPAHSAPAQAVMSRSGGTIYRYVVDENGGVSQEQRMTGPTEGVSIDVDPGGRFALFFGGGVFRAYAIAASGELVYRSIFDPPPLRSIVDAMDLTNDGRVVYTVEGDFSQMPVTGSLRRIVINNRLLGVWTSPEYRIDQGPLSGVYGITAVPGHASVEDVLFVTHLQSGGLRGLNVIQVTSEEMILTPYHWDNSIPGNSFGRGERSFDGSQVAFMTIDGIRSYRLNTDNTVTELPVFDLSNETEMGMVGYSPSSPYLVCGRSNLNSLGLQASGEITEMVDDEFILSVVEDFAVSIDGTRILASHSFISGQAQLTAFGLTPEGQIEAPATSLTLSHVYAGGMAFIPPRTPSTLPGDANVDGLLDIADVVFVLNEALPDDKPILLPQNFANADLDQDIDIDQDDFEALVGLLLGP